ncbi:MAG: hypothetical protein C0510_06875 [Erythrobacter sp.]|nr:hypothetical protein [Erythrobacter sp.]
MPTTRTTAEAQKERDAELIKEAISAFVSQHSELRQAAVVTEIPPPLKWASIIVGGIMTAATTAGFIWLVATVNEMQLTLARMDERIGAWQTMQDARYIELEKRMSKIEADKDRAHAPS